MEMRKILVWDLPTRFNHWLMAGCFAVAYATGDSEAWRLVHIAAGLILAALVACQEDGHRVGTAGRGCPVGVRLARRAHHQTR